MPRFCQIDETTIGDHHYLRPADQCLYLYEYTAGRDYSYSQTNNLISNLKKKPSQSQRPDYRYKRAAINQCINDIRDALKPEWLASATLVPVPGSKAIGDPDHDPRMEQICRGLGAHVDVRCLITQSQSTQASHEAGTGSRRTLEELLELYTVDEALLTPAPHVVGIVDDVLTTGTHFRAVQQTLANRFATVPIIGIFIARRVPPNPFEGLDEFDDL